MLLQVEEGVKQRGGGHGPHGVGQNTHVQTHCTKYQNKRPASAATVGMWGLPT